MRNIEGLGKALLIGASIVIFTNAVAAFLLPPGIWQDYLPRAGLLLALLVALPMLVGKPTAGTPR